MNHYECGNLFGACRRLLEGSRLVLYTGDSFVCNSDEEGLESWWRGNFDQDFGRYMAWVWFSVGAENLVKAALVCGGLLEQKQARTSYPYFWRDTDRAEWIDRILRSRRAPGGEYGMLGDIWQVKLDELSHKCGLAETEGKELKAAYKYLTQAIRNRDAHSYIENQRRQDFPAAEAIFMPAFNTLLRVMKTGGHFTKSGPR